MIGDPFHAGLVQGAAVRLIGILHLAQSNDVLDDLLHGSKLCGSRAADLPVVLGLAQQTVVVKLGHTVRQPCQRKAAYAEELVGGEVHHVHAQFLGVQGTVGSVLDGIADDEDVRVLLAGFLADGLQVVDVSGDIGRGHAAQHSSILIDEVEDCFSVHAAGSGVGLCHTQLTAVFAGVVGHRVEGGGVLQHSGNIVGTLGMVGEDAGHIHHDLGGGVAGVDNAGLCAEDNALNVDAGLIFQCQQFQSQLVGVLRGIGHLADTLKFVLCGLQAK